MSYVYHQFDGKPIKSWTSHVDIEDEAMEQLKACARLPFIYKHIAVMPDVHWGYGATVGSVIPTKGAVVPCAVGVDIGCGMRALRTDLYSKDLPDNLADLRTGIEHVVPHGRSNNGRNGDKGAWQWDRPRLVGDTWTRGLMQDYTVMVAKHPKLGHAQCANHLGTLGTGNHFIEVCLDETDRVWVVLHSGSRGVGNRIGSYFTTEAKRYCRDRFIQTPSPDLGYFPEVSPWFKDYIDAVKWGQRYAKENRMLMMEHVIGAMRQTLGHGVVGDVGDDGVIDCHHNYMDFENFGGKNVIVTRKGAVRARKGDLGIIPGSMGERSYIVEGLGNVDSFNSCSHGAGRAMSRRAARERFTVEDHVKATEGVECRKDESVLDETPGAYKDIDAVMASQVDLVRPLHTLKQIVCVKG